MRGRTSLPLAMLAAGVILGYADRTRPDPTKTQIALPLAVAPTIDGVISPDEWTRAGGAAGDFWAVTVVTDADGNPALRGGTIGDAGTVPTDNTDLSYVIYAGFDAQNLYVAVRVKDNLLVSDDAAEGSANGNTWMDDSVEVFVDGDNSNYPNRDTTGTNPQVVGSGGQFVITVNNAYREAEAGNPGYGPGQAWRRSPPGHGGWHGLRGGVLIALRSHRPSKPGTDQVHGGGQRR
ncbi:MAG: hypothetical protein HS113_24030 [Verrucomicrobiales bacterium]|nr:hypothetical protein [Verrucomicrobiales bacterium]